MPEKTKLISITDITSYLYCPRKFYLTRIIGIKEKPNQKMVIGRLKHTIIELFSKKEESLVNQIDKDYDKLDLVIMYENFIAGIAEKVFFDSREIIEAMRISKEEVFKKTMKDFANDLKVRIASIKQALEKGHKSEDIWKNLPSKFISELRLESCAYGLKGRIDRVEIIEKDNLIIPYELKTREDKVYYSDEIQLSAYAMMLEDIYHRVIKTGFIESGSLKQEIEITQEHKDNVLKLAEEIRNLKQGDVPPMPSNFNKCSKCDLQEECMKL
jgi:CRISPR-associated protein Cas4